MASDRKARLDEVQDTAVAGTFPASDPPSTSADTGNRAVPPAEMMGQGAPVTDAVTLRRRFPTGEAAKLALEGLVRDGPVDRNAAHIEATGSEGCELHLAVPAADAPRIRTLLSRA